MEVQYVGETKEFEAWANQNSMRHVTVKSGDILFIGKWGNIESVLTSEDEWLCDFDSPLFKEEFVVLD